MPKQAKKPENTEIEVKFYLSVPKCTDAQARRMLNQLLGCLENEFDNGLGEGFLDDVDGVSAKYREDFGYSFGFQDVKKAKITHY